MQGCYMARQAERVVLAWFATPAAARACRSGGADIAKAAPLQYLQLTKERYTRHPLYLKGSLLPAISLRDEWALGYPRYFSSSASQPGLPTRRWRSAKG